MRYMAATDEVVYRGWMKYRWGNTTYTAYFGPYSAKATASGVVTREIRSRSRMNNWKALDRGVHEARFVWKPVEETDDSGS